MNLSYDVKQDGINEVIDESGNMVMMLREVAWQGKEHRLELRKWIVDTETEKPMKGVSFMTKEGPHNLTETMTRLGYGNTKAILGNLVTREDFEQSLIETIGKEAVDKSKATEYQVVSEDYFIPNMDNLTGKNKDK